tara:strand:- start:1273 stop:1386 length:114 start_codon:yes stop_codon:yes gene_type:complete
MENDPKIPTEGQTLIAIMLISVVATVILNAIVYGITG